jgi:hypothetical protein
MQQVRRAAVVVAAAWVAGASLGCASYATRCANMGDFRPQPMGTVSDPVWQEQEANAEASDFVVYQHEWTGENAEMNDAGLDHLKRIADRADEVPFPILIEPSSMSPRPDTEYGYPVHRNPDLDMARRDIIVRSLASMGVAGAEERVYVSPALTPGYEAFEAERAYGRGMGGYNFGFGFGGFGSGFGGLGGGFGGGGFF